MHGPGGGKHTRTRTYRHRPWLLLAPALAVLVLGFALPVGAFLLLGLAEMEGGRVAVWPTLAPAAAFASDGYYLVVVADTVAIATAAILCAFALGYPLAYAMWRLGRSQARLWIGLVVLSPILVGTIPRSYGWSVILGDDGPVNGALMRLGLVAEPLQLLHGSPAVIVALAHILLPFVVVPIFVTMLRIDPALKEAAVDLGASPWTSFRRVTLPLTLPGVAAGGILATVLSLGALATPVLLGGGRVQVLAVEIYRATVDIDWTVAALGSVVLLALAMAATWALGALGRIGTR